MRKDSIWQQIGRWLWAAPPPKIKPAPVVVHYEVHQHVHLHAPSSYQQALAEAAQNLPFLISPAAESHWQQPIIQTQRAYLEQVR